MKTSMSDSNAQSQAELQLDDLPPLPQSQAIRDLAPRLWKNEQVAAVWLGGSLAAGTGDIYSDIDLRVAVPAEDLAEWETSDLHSILDGPALARQSNRANSRGAPNTAFAGLTAITQTFWTGGTSSGINVEKQSV